MKMSYRKMLALEVVMILGLLINVIFLKQFQLTNIINIVIWSLLIIGIKLLLELEKDKSLNKVDTLQVTFIYTFVYLLMTYILGVIVGFNMTPYNLSIIGILKNIVPIVILIILQETFRFNIVTKAKDNPLIITLMIIIITASEIIFGFSYIDLTTNLGKFELIGVLILPSIVNNIVLTYISLKSGKSSPILYRIITEGYIYLVPIVPGLNVYLDSIFKIIFPTVLFLKFNTIYAKKRFNVVRRRMLNKRAIDFTVATAILVVVVLVSGAFNYYAMAIGSASMEKVIYKGDAVVIEKTKENIKKGMVIAYRHDGRTIVHRVKQIKKENNKMIITTKGDNNDDQDNWEVYQNDIIGIVKMKIPLIGWPSVWLSELL